MALSLQIAASKAAMVAIAAGILVALLHAAWFPLVKVPYAGAWDNFCYYWDDGANFVDNVALNKKPLTRAGLWEIITVRKINVFDGFSDFC